MPGSHFESLSNPGHASRSLLRSMSIIFLRAARAPVHTRTRADCSCSEDDARAHLQHLHGVLALDLEQPCGRESDSAQNIMLAPRRRECPHLSPSLPPRWMANHPRRPGHGPLGHPLRAGEEGWGTGRSWPHGERLPPAVPSMDFGAGAPPSGVAFPRQTLAVLSILSGVCACVNARAHVHIWRAASLRLLLFLVEFFPSSRVFVRVRACACILCGAERLGKRARAVPELLITRTKRRMQTQDGVCVCLCACARAFEGERVRRTNRERSFCTCILCGTARALYARAV